ncbi:MAG TPA: response regulator transcription factor [bacterium]|nr:response regulator transcription factor [bacterium]
MKRMRILLVDDHALFRQGIKSLLVSNPEIEVVGEAENGKEALEKTRVLQPDVILMDIQMPVCDGLEATALIHSEFPDVKIVILTVSEEDENLFEAIKRGAQGFLLKKIQPQALVQTLRGVCQGEASISRLMAGKILREFSRLQKAAAPASPLSEREKEILNLVAEGQTNKEIGVALAISDNTVKNHLHNIMEKLHLHNRAEAAAYALRAGFLTSKPGSP